MNKKTANKFWRFVNIAEKPEAAELELYGDISQTSWWGDEVTPKLFAEELKALGDVSEITVRINSGGGDVFAAFGIYTRLKDHGARIVVKIDGWAASAATLIAMAGDEIQIPAAAVFMIHNAKIGLCSYYSETDLAKMQDELKTITKSIINTYVAKTGKSEEEISQLLDAETWFDGKQAVENGFCDVLMFDENIETNLDDASHVFVNSVEMNIKNFKSIPTTILSRRPTNDGLNINDQKNNTKEKEMDIKNKADLAAAYPDFVAEIKSDAAAEERKRIKNIEEIAVDGCDEMVADAKFENPIAASELALKIVAESKKQGASFLAQRKEDTDDGNVNKITGNVEENDDGAVDKYDVAIDNVLPKVE